MEDAAMSGWGGMGSMIFDQTVAAEAGKAVVRTWYHEGKAGPVWRGAFRGYKVTRMKVFPAAIDDEEVLATFERPDSDNGPWDEDFPDSTARALDRAAAFAAEWNAGAARRERALRDQLRRQKWRSEPR